MVAAAAGIFLTRSIWRSFINGNARRMEMWLRNTLFTHLQTLGPDFFNHQKTGDLMAYAINDVNAIRMTFGPGFALACTSLFTGAFSIFQMGAGVNLRLALACLLPIPFLLALIFRLGSITRERFRRVQEAFAAVSDRVQENISGIRVIKAYAQETPEVERFESLNRDMRDTNVSMVKVSSAMSPMVSFIFGISFTICLIYGSHLVRTGVITLGELVAFNGYLTLIISPVQSVARVTNILQRGLASLKRYAAVVETPPTVVDAAVNKHKGPLQGEIRVSNLTFHYPDGGDAALRDVSFELKPGKTLGILGHTGSGKTTLCNLLLKLFNPARGMISFDGADIHDIALDVLRGGIGYVPQDNFLFSATIAENIRFYAPEATMEDIEQAAKLADIYDSIQEFPDGFQTQVGERGVTLSGGQKQRVAIARMLMQGAPIMVFDDSLSAVDAETDAKIRAELAHSLGSATVILISHRITTLMQAQRILVLSEGRVADIGTHEELISRPGIYRDIYEIQMSSDDRLLLGEEAAKNGI